MNTAKTAPVAFHLQAEPGTRFALFHPPLGNAARGAILYAHPFAEEMNKSRRMAALQARAFAAAGFAVLQVDLHGCGDSDGDFGDARWPVWKRDLELATDWLRREVAAPVHLWGLRLGATLALASWQDAPDRYASALLWQPVLDGAPFVTQFLRLAVAREALRSTGEKLTTERLRASLARGNVVEVAGYSFVAELAAAIDAQSVANGRAPSGPVHWLDIRPAASELPPAVRATLAAWQGSGADVTYRAIAGQPFWSSVEIIEIPELITATLSMYAE